jgi:hypothetical protein
MYYTEKIKKNHTTLKKLFFCIRLSLGGGWAEPKNGEAVFMLWVDGAV